MVAGKLRVSEIAIAVPERVPKQYVRIFDLKPGIPQLISGIR